VRLKPDNASAQFDLGLAELALNRAEAAAAQFKEAIRLDPKMAGAHVNLCAAYNGLGQHSEAINACKEGLRLNPSLTAGHYQLGFAYLKSGDIVAAKAQQHILESLDPDIAKRLLDLLPK